MIYVFEGGSIVYDGSILTEEEKAQAVAVTELPTLEPKQDYYVVIKADKSQEKVWAEYVKKQKTEEEIRQEGRDEVVLELVKEGVL